jgi:DNA-binding NarL/FixJ family response regulator
MPFQNGLRSKMIDVPEGTILIKVIMDLMERVTALEQARPAQLRPILRSEDRPVVHRANGSKYAAVTLELQKEIGRLYGTGMSINKVALELDVSSQTAMNHLRKLGLVGPPRKRRPRLHAVTKKETA